MLNALGSLFLRYRVYIAPLTFVLVLGRAPEAALADGSAYWFSACFGALALAMYLINKVTDLEEDERSGANEQMSRAAIPGVLVLSALLTFGPGLYLLLTWKTAFFAYACFAVLGFWYSWRIPILSRRIRLKDILVVKNLTSSVIWAACTALGPAMWSGVLTARDLAFFAETAAAVMIIELLWDLRDMVGDARVGVRTVPNAWGINATKLLCVVFLTLTGAMGVFRDAREVTYIPTIAATLALIAFASPARRPAYYHALVIVWLVQATAFASGWTLS